MLVSNEKITPTVNDWIHPDGWDAGNRLDADDGFSDSSFPGCQFRLRPHKHEEYHLAVNVVVTGGRHFVEYDTTRTKSRCQIEFVGDGEPSEFTGGWIFHDL